MARFIWPGHVPSRSTVVYSGEGAPSVVTGTANDLYLDKLTGDLYQKNEANTAWVLTGSIAGGAGAGEGFIVLRGAGDPVNGVAGTGVGEADTGSRYINETANTEWWQSGEIDNVQWLQVLAP